MNEVKQNANSVPALVNDGWSKKSFESTRFSEEVVVTVKKQTSIYITK